MNISKKLSSTVLGVVVMSLLSVATALARTPLQVGVDVKVGSTLYSDAASTSAGTNVLLLRIDSMKRLTQEQKDSLSASLNASITDMLAQSHVFTLSAVDRIDNIGAKLQTISMKLSARLAAEATTTNNTVLQATLADMNAKITDSQIQATAAENLVANLKPANGDKTIRAANLKALTDAHAKIKLGAKDLFDARKDAITITAALKINLKQ